MSAAMGRDGLGRLVYEGDKVDCCGEWSVVSHEGAFGYLNLVNDDCMWCSVPAEAVEIDLERSPRKSNYARYFANNGPLRNVVELFCQACLDERCVSCPFRNWAEVFDVEVSEGFFDCYGFIDWLEGEATI